MAESTHERLDRLTRWVELNATRDPRSTLTLDVIVPRRGHVVHVSTEDVEWLLSIAGALGDLRDRFVTAACTLEADANDGRGHFDENARKRAKAAGVRLALSYLDEITRKEGN